MAQRWFGQELPDPQREFVWHLLLFAGHVANSAARAEPRPQLLFNEEMDAARSALLADSEAGRWSDPLNVQLLGLLAWCRGLHTGEREEMRLAASMLEMVLRCAPALLPEPLRSAGREQRRSGRRRPGVSPAQPHRTGAAGG